MSIFKDYAAYYNLLYQHKNYEAEAAYIIDFIKKYHPLGKSILNLGCGTGKHDYIFAQAGYDVTGVDLSSDMVQLARQGAKALETVGELNFLVGDIRDLRLGRKFDAVLSLFHVISYQTSNSDLSKALETAFMHLKPGGIFIFDCWYGPAVLSDPPVVRVKNLENESLEVIRIAQPQTHPNENVVDVNYQVLIKEKSTGQHSEIRETHRMRYLFKPELEVLFQQLNLSLLECTEWMTHKEPGFSSWNVCFVLQK